MEFLKSFKARYSYVLWCFLTNSHIFWCFLTNSHIFWCFLTNSHIFLAENNNRVEFNFGNVRIWTNNLTYPNNSGVNGELRDVNFTRNHSLTSFYLTRIISFSNSANRRQYRVYSFKLYRKINQNII